MEQSGFWNFFFATGLPQAYLAARLREGEEVVFPPILYPHFFENLDKAASDT